MRTLRRYVAAVMLIAYLPACSSFRTTDLTPQEAITGQRVVRVTLAGPRSTHVVVKEPWVRNDSIGGVTEFNPGWTVPLSSVVEIRRKRTDPLMTGLAILGVVVVGMVVAVGAACSGDGFC